VETREADAHLVMMSELYFLSVLPKLSGNPPAALAASCLAAVRARLPAEVLARVDHRVDEGSGGQPLSTPSLLHQPARPRPRPWWRSRRVVLGLASLVVALICIAVARGGVSLSLAGALLVALGGLVWRAIRKGVLYPSPSHKKGEGVQHERETT
jgi:hypothetical protein